MSTTRTADSRPVALDASPEPLSFPERRARHRLLARLLAAALICSPLVAGADAPDGAALAAEKGCVACHGLDGVAIAPIYPHLDGQYVRYLRLQLLAYRSGKRVNAIMNGFAAELSDEEIRALADHYGDD